MTTFIPLSVLAILPILIITPILASFFKAKVWQWIVIIIMTLFIITELISIYFSGGFVDYQFFVNLNVQDIIAGLFIFKVQAALAIICFFLFIFLLFRATRLFREKTALVARGILIIVGFLSINYAKGPIDKLTEIYQIVSAPKTELSDALNQLGITNYVSKDALQAIKGKNIIVISLESFEQGFLASPNITPNLSQLSKKYTYFDQMPMALGSSWTTASMYTYMTGMPFLIGGGSTSPLVHADKTQLVSLGDVLNRAGYQTRYIMGSPNFAGMGHIISMFNIEVISEANYPDVYPDAPFGLYDHDIFDVAKKELDKLSVSRQPFALFLSTISTHAPNGFVDDRMEKNLGPINEFSSNSMDFVAASLDYNLGQFIQHLEQTGLLENTVFFIFPDHLMMGAGTETIAKLSEQPRQLYMITNSSSYILNRKPDSVIYQIDLPRLILNGAQVRTNAVFLTDFLRSTIDKKLFIEEHKRDIATVNRSAEIIHTGDTE